MRKRSESTDFTIHAEAPTYDFIKNETCILYPEVTQGPYWYPPSELLQRDMVQDQVCDGSFRDTGVALSRWMQHGTIVHCGCRSEPAIEIER
jgi:hypothetical protein